MTITQHTRRQTPIPYTRPAAREDLLAQALGCIVAGRPLPDALRAPALARVRPASAAEGIAAILAGPATANG